MDGQIFHEPRRENLLLGEGVFAALINGIIAVYFIVTYVGFQRNVLSEQHE